MSEIDWSKAPEGATHYMEYPLRWRKVVNGQSFGFAEGKWHMIDCPQIRRYIEIPGGWYGSGLPPVGTVCECQNRGYGDIWQKVTVLAHHNGHAWVRGDDGKHCMTVPPHGNFRPLRTPEQIAKQKRDDAVHQMGMDAGFHGSVQEFATRLYMLGYRKVEGGAE